MARTFSPEMLAKYTDEELNSAKSMGDRNAAPYLLQLDTMERRARAVNEAHILVNLLGFRYSEAVYDAVKSLQASIDRGTEEAELYGEKQCRMDLERQQALREQREAHDRIAFEAYQRRMAAGEV